MIVTSTCFFHGPEEVDDPPFACHECGHLWATVESFREASDSARAAVYASILDHICDETVCPLCTHDL